MMNALFDIDMIWFKSVLVTSSVCLLIGWVCLSLWRWHAARAYQMLWLCVLAAVLVPCLSLAVHKLNMGVLSAESQGLAMSAWWDQSSARLTGSSISEATVSTSSRRVPSLSGVQSGPEPAARLSTPAWKGLFPWIWLLVTGALLWRVLVAFVRGVLRVKRALPVEVLPNGVDLPGLKASLGIKRPVTVAVSDTAGCPVVWCWARSITIIMPTGFLDHRSVTDLNAIFCHELAHAKRRDHVSGLLSELAVCCMPWQPLMWWARQRLVTLSEHACDDWVVAFGYQEADYAESLLDMLPQRQFAFTPAVATRQSGLAIRIKRILARQCGNPRKGRVWSCLAVSLMVMVSLGVAFAQVREVVNQPTAKTDCKLCMNARFGAYGQSIRGVLIDPNDDPVDGWYPGGGNVCIMPLSGFSVNSTRTGHFHDVPYSKDWLIDGKLTLLALCKNDNLVSMMNLDPTQGDPTIKLMPGITVTGKVINEAGEPVSKLGVWLDWSGPYQCPMPINSAETDDLGQFSLSPIPYGQRFTLRAENEALSSTEIMFSTINLADKIVTLEPMTVRPRIDEEDVSTVLKDLFDQVYSLDSEEVVRFIKPPFIVERQRHMFTNNRKPNFFINFLSNHSIRAVYTWDGQLNNVNFFGSDSWPIRDVLFCALRIPVYEIELPEKMERSLRLPHGDWICRASATTEEKLRVLEAIVKRDIYQNIHFEKQIRDQETLVVIGTFVPKTTDEGIIYIKETEDDPGAHEIIEVATLDEMLEQIGDITLGIPIINRCRTNITGPIHFRQPKWGVRWFDDRGPEEAKAKRDFVCKTLSEQTGLEITSESRPVEVWVLTEDF